MNSNNLEDKILMKEDGLPTYHFANVVDDHLMKITTIIRGEEWLPSLPIHKLIYDAFGWDMPKHSSSATNTEPLWIWKIEQTRCFAK